MENGAMTVRDKNLLLSIFRGNSLKWACLVTLNLLSRGLSAH